MCWLNCSKYRWLRYAALGCNTLMKGEKMTRTKKKWWKNMKCLPTTTLCIIIACANRIFSLSFESINPNACTSLHINNACKNWNGWTAANSNKKGTKVYTIAKVNKEGKTSWKMHSEHSFMAALNCNQSKFVEHFSLWIHPSLIGKDETEWKTNSSNYMCVSHVRCFLLNFFFYFFSLSVSTIRLADISCVRFPFVKDYYKETVVSFYSW